MKKRKKNWIEIANLEGLKPLFLENMIRKGFSNGVDPSLGFGFALQFLLDILNGSSLRTVPRYRCLWYSRVLSFFPESLFGSHRWFWRKWSVFVCTSYRAMNEVKVWNLGSVFVGLRVVRVRERRGKEWRGERERRWCWCHAHPLHSTPHTLSGSVAVTINSQRTLY